jgi:hypothetical protein
VVAHGFPIPLTPSQCATAERAMEVERERMGHRAGGARIWVTQKDRTNGYRLTIRRRTTPSQYFTWGRSIGDSETHPKAQRA